MKFKCSAKIQAPITAVAAAFTDPDYLKKSQEGFIRKEALSGEPWTEGSRSKLVYKKLELVETVLINNLPHEFKGSYEHKHMTNTMHCRFKALDNGSTQLDQEIHYTHFSGWLPKLMARFFPGLFQKQVQKWLDRFKATVEADHD